MNEDETTFYRTCFMTDAGKTTLSHMLAVGGYFDDDIETVGEMAVVNFLKGILKRIGIYDKESTRSYVDNILNIPPNLERKEK